MSGKRPFDSHIMYIWKSGKCLFLYFIGRNQYTCAEVFQWLETFDNKFTMNPGTVSLETTASAIHGNICICGKELLISVGKYLIKRLVKYFLHIHAFQKKHFFIAIAENEVNSSSVFIKNQFDYTKSKGISSNTEKRVRIFGDKVLAGS